MYKPRVKTSSKSAVDAEGEQELQTNSQEKITGPNLSKTSLDRTNVPKPAKTSIDKKNVPKPIKLADASSKSSKGPKLQSSKKGGVQTQSFAEIADYLGQGQVLENIGPVFLVNGKVDPNGLKRIQTSANGAVVEFTGDGPYYADSSFYRDIREKIPVPALTLKFGRTDSNGIYQPVAIQDLKAGDRDVLPGWVVTYAMLYDNNPSLVIGREQRMESLKVDGTMPVRSTDFLSTNKPHWIGIYQLKLNEVLADGTAVVELLELGRSLGKRSIRPNDTNNTLKDFWSERIQIHVYDTTYSSNPKDCSARIAILEEEKTIGAEDRKYSEPGSTYVWSSLVGSHGLRKDTNLMSFSQYDLTSNMISYWGEDVSVSRYGKYGSFLLPLGYGLYNQGLVNDRSFNLYSKSDLGPYPIADGRDGNTKKETIKGYALHIISDQEVELAAPDKDRAFEFNIFHPEGEKPTLQNLKVLIKTPGNTYYFEDKLPAILHWDKDGNEDAWLDVVNADIAKQNTLDDQYDLALQISERARSKDPSITDHIVTTSYLYKEQNNQLVLKPSNTATPNIWYQGLKNIHQTPQPDPEPHESLITERGSISNINSMSDARHSLNIGGNAYGANDNFARFSWHALPPAQPQVHDLENTNGGTKNGLGFERFPTNAPIESPNNSLYSDAQCYYHFYNPDGTIFSWSPIYQNFISYSWAGFEARPKLGLKDGETVIPIFGEEMQLMSHDDTARRWVLENNDGVQYAFQNGSTVKKIVNGQDIADPNDPLCAYPVSIGRWDSLMGAMLKGTESTPLESLWLYQPSSVTLNADVAFSLFPNTSMVLKTQPRDMKLTLSVEYKGLIKINLTGMSDYRVSDAARIGIDVNVDDLQDLYYLPTTRPGVSDSGNVIDLKYRLKGETDFHYASTQVETPYTGAGRHELVFQSNNPDHHEMRLSNDDRNLIFSEYVSEYAHDTTPSGLFSRTFFGFDTSFYDTSGRIYLDAFTYGSTSQSYVSSFIGPNNAGTPSVLHTVTESTAYKLEETKYTRAGTLITIPPKDPRDMWGMLGSITLSPFDNSTYPTRFGFELTEGEKRKPLQVQNVEPTVSTEFTKGQTSLGFMDWLKGEYIPMNTIRNHSTLDSQNLEYFQKERNIDRVEYMIFSPLGSMYNKVSNTISNLPLNAAFYLEPKEQLQATFVEHFYPTQFADYMQSAKTFDANPSIIPIKNREYKLLLKTNDFDTSMLPDAIKAGLDPSLQNIHAPAWVVCDHDKVYLLVSGLPALMMIDWEILPLDHPLWKNDPLEGYAAFIGKGNDLFDVSNGTLDQSHDALWVVPTATLNAKKEGYTPNQVMDWKGGTTIGYFQLAPFTVETSLVGAAESVLRAPSYRIAPPPNVFIRATSSGGKVVDFDPDEVVYYAPQRFIDGVQSGLLGGEINNGVGSWFGDSKFELVREGQVVGRINLHSGGDKADTLTFLETSAPYPLQTQPPPRAFELTSSTTVDWNKYDLGSGNLSYGTPLSFSPSLSETSAQILKNKPRAFDQRISTLSTAVSDHTGRGSVVKESNDPSPLLELGFQLANTPNDYRMDWWIQSEPLVKYVEGNVLTDWEKKDSISLIKNVYPNPVQSDGTLHMRVQVATPGQVSFSVYDATGQQFYGTLVGGFLMPGEYDMELPLSRFHADGSLFLSDGAYMLLMSEGNQLPVPIGKPSDRLAKFIVQGSSR